LRARVQRKARLGAWLGIGTGVVLTAGKLTAGWLGHSAALVADGFDALADISTSVAVLIGLIVAARPADRGHPYGHGKAEVIVAKTLGLGLLLLAGQILWHNGAKLLGGQPLVVPRAWVLAVAAVSMALSGAMALAVWRLARETLSSSLAADARHHMAHTIATGAVLIGVALAVIGGDRWAFLDPLMAMLVALLIGYSGVEVLRESWRQIMDAPAADRLRGAVRREARNVEGVLGTEVCNVRRAGMDLLVDIHVEVDPQITVQAGHEVASAVRDHLMGRFPRVRNVMVHIEPFYPDDHVEEP
jgi:cation diffusion facilitator family transporter